MEQDVAINPLVKFNNKELRCEVAKGRSVRSEPVRVKIKSKMVGPQNANEEVIKVLQGPNQLKWRSPYTEATTRIFSCTLEGNDIADSQGDCSSDQNFNGRESFFEYGMKARSCSEEIVTTRKVYINSSFKFSYAAITFLNC